MGLDFLSRGRRIAIGNRVSCYCFSVTDTVIRNKIEGVPVARIFACIAAAGLMLSAGAAQAAQAGNAAEGKNVFMDNCAVCHSNEKGAPSKIGPNLFGVVGRIPRTSRLYVFAGHDEGESHLGCADIADLSAWARRRKCRAQRWVSRASPIRRMRPTSSLSCKL